MISTKAFISMLVFFSLFMIYLLSCTEETIIANTPTQADSNLVKVESRPEIHFWDENNTPYYTVETSAIVYLDGHSYNTYFSYEHTKDWNKVDSLRNSEEKKVAEIVAKIQEFYQRYPQKVDKIPIEALKNKEN